MSINIWCETKIFVLQMSVTFLVQQIFIGKPKKNMLVSIKIFHHCFCNVNSSMFAHTPSYDTKKRTD